MRAVKIELVVVDFEGYGEKSIADMVSGHRDLLTMILSTESTDIGDWSDDHPLNQNSSKLNAARAYFPSIERAVLAKAMPIQNFSVLVAKIVEETRRNNGFTDCELGREIAASFNRALDLVQAKSWIYDDQSSKAMPIPKQEPLGYVVIGQGISFYRTTKEEAEYQANCLEWRDDKGPVIHPVYIDPQPAQAAAIPDKKNFACLTDYDDGYEKGWNDCVDAALSASPKPE